MTKMGMVLAIVGAALVWEEAARAQSVDTTPPPVPTADPAPVVAPSAAPAPPAPPASVESAPSPSSPAAAPPAVAVSVQPTAPAAPAAVPAPSAVAPSGPGKVDDGDDGNWLDYLRIGAVAGVGFPRPLSILGMAKIDRIVSIGVEYSLLPQITIDNSQTTFWAILGDVRVFPFRDSFFIGLAAGHQRAGAAASFPFPSPYPSLTEEIVADTWLINPRIGFLKTWGWGLTLGIDVGVQIPLSSSFSSTAPSSVTVGNQVYPVPANNDANNVAHSLGTSVLPTVDLLRIGLLL